jgi:hypothetical protein
MSGSGSIGGGTIYPLVRGRPYTVAALRAAEVSLLAQRQADQALSSRLRLQNRKEIAWAKIRNEEWAPLKLLADGLQIADSETFCWTPEGAADFELSSGGRTLNIQCTMAYDQLIEAKHQGGHLHHMEMVHGSLHGFYFGGGAISEPTARDVSTDLVTWRAGIVAAIEAKLHKDSYRRRELDLLVYARGCAFGLIDFDFAEIVYPALDAVGRENWGRMFSNIYVVDDGGFAMADEPGGDHR